MIHVAPIDTDTFATDTAVTPLESEDYLDDHGFPVTVEEVYSVVNTKTDDEDSGYIVKVVETLEKPLEQADALADQTTILMCSCKGYRYHDGVQDLDGVDKLRWEPCKHCEAVDPTLKAANDNLQEQL